MDIEFGVLRLVNVNDDTFFRIVLKVPKEVVLTFKICILAAESSGD